MPVMSVADAELYYEDTGHGAPLVLVHGSWGDHGNWAPVVPLLAPRHRVVSYDRRGHSRSTEPAGQGSIKQDVEDLAALIRSLDLGPCAVAGNSFGALVTLRLAAGHPDLVRVLIAHEPPGLGLLADDDTQTALRAHFTERTKAVMALIEQGEDAVAAEQFVETIAIGPGGWAQLPLDIREVFIRNARTWLDEMHDPDALTLDLPALHNYAGPVLLSQGDHSPPLFAPVLDQIHAALPQARRHVFAGAGHVPHATHASDYATTVTAFIGDPD